MQNGDIRALRQAPNVRDAALERLLENVRPDASAYINGIPVAIEVQISSLSFETIMRRTTCTPTSEKGLCVTVGRQIWFKTLFC